jgi:hypothetical protein
MAALGMSVAFLLSNPAAGLLGETDEIDMMGLLDEFNIVVCT